MSCVQGCKAPFPRVFPLLVVGLAPGTEDSLEPDFQFQQLQLSGLLAIYLIFIYLFVCLFWVSLRSPGCLGTVHVEQAGSACTEIPLPLPLSLPPKSWD